MASNPSPQERWQAFRATLPQLTFWQKIGLGIVSSLAVLLFIIFVLPFLLGLEGAKPENPQNLADANGHFSQIEGLYYVHEQGAGETVILIHGFNESTVTWQETIPALAEAGYNVYAIDLVGFGLSEKGLEADLSHPTQVERIIRWMDEQQLEKANVVGHAMGANVAVHLAFKYPERVESLILSNATLQTSNTAALPEWVLEIPSFKRWVRVLLRWIIPATTETQLLSAAENDEAITDELVKAYDRTLKTKDWDLSILAMVRDNTQNTLPQNLNSLDIPVLILWGAEDGWISPEIGQQLANDISNANYVELEGVGHLPMHEAPHEFNAALVDFLN